MKIRDLHQLFLNSKGATTDTRSLTPSTLFFALKGENFNANNFAQQALDSGASYCIIDEVQTPMNERFILVDNVLQTLQELANFHRKYLDIPVVALTGSNGKTTTKELINTVLIQQYNTHATQGNYNNHIGVPLTLLQMDKTTEIGIVEMGANHAGEIAQLCEIAAPNYGYITNFGKAHLEGFGSEEGVVKAKSELYDYLKRNKGAIFVNIDDKKQVKQIGDYQNIKTFSSGSTSDFTIKLENDSPFVNVKVDDVYIQTQLLGRYNFTNIAAAISVGLYFKLELDVIKKGIESYVPKNNRSQVIKQNSNTIIMDAYNANPTSVEAALQNFKAMKGEEKVVILGDMFELGSQSFHEHQAVISMVEDFDFTKAYFVGLHFFNHQKEFPFANFFKNVADVKKHIIATPIKNTLILVKGSRGMALESILNVLEF
jgi:UDP-N-acetylmuramoyl-tripeptide--D-alanyl-D-alanine ligase